MKSTAKTVGLVMMIMILSRVLSLVSTSVYITFFGVQNPEINIYSYAIQFPNIVFSILGTALVTVVIPSFSGFIANGEEKRAFQYADDIMSLSTIATIVLTIIGILVAPLIISLSVYGTNSYAFAVMALKIMMPVMIFYAWNYILQGILQSLGRFNMPAFVSIPSSLIVIAYVVLLGERFGVKGLLIATFIGLSMQALILIPPLYRTKYRFHPSLNYKNQDVRNALKLVPPVIVGTSAYQLNMLFNLAISATFINTVAIMSTVQNLVLSAVLAMIYSVTAVIFPKLSMLAAKKDMEGFKESLLAVLKSVFFLLIPIAFGMFVMRDQILSLLIGWKKITPDDLVLAGSMLAFYSIGVIGTGIKEVVDRAFYALNDTAKPAINGLVIMVINIGTSLVLIRVFAALGLPGVLGLPVAYSISSIIGGSGILVLIRRKIGPFGGKKLISSVGKIIVSCIVMAVIVLLINNGLKDFDFGMAILNKGIKLFVPSCVGAIVYFACTYFLKMDETRHMIRKLKNKLGII